MFKGTYICSLKLSNIGRLPLLSLVLLSIAFLLSTTCNAAAWLQDEGKGLIIANIQQYTSTKYWDREGDLKSGPRFNQFSINPYMEYGAQPNITIGLNPFAKRISQANQVSNFGLNNITPFVLLLVKKKDWTTNSIQFSYNQPFKARSFGANLSSQSAYGIIDRQRYIDVRLLRGTGGTFNKEQSKTWYADAEVSYRANFDGAADEVHVDFMLGLKTLDQRLVFEVKEQNTIGLHNPKSEIWPDYNVCTVIPNIQYFSRDKTVGFQFGVQQDFYGTNIGKGTAPFIALWLRF